MSSFLSRDTPRTGVGAARTGPAQLQRQFLGGTGDTAFMMFNAALKYLEDKGENSTIVLRNHWQGSFLMN